MVEQQWILDSSNNRSRSYVMKIVTFFLISVKTKTNRS